MSEAKKDFYEPKEVEQKYYEFCKNAGYFEPGGNAAIAEEGKNFALMMPPPNVTGVLHIGHALTFTLQDIIARYKRMKGYCVLYQPGLDHAGIATQNVVEKQLLAQGVRKEELGREKFIEKVWEWKEKSGGMIMQQMQALGITPAFSRTRFTMDEGLQTAVKRAFISLYRRGLIERNYRMINWCCHDGALSDIEVEHEEHHGKLYYLRYFLEPAEGATPRQNPAPSENPLSAGAGAAGGEYLIVATTRPETYFGDTAVMVNPQDERYAAYIGRRVRLPLLGRSVEVIADEHVDAGFGTGVVKVTPAHDVNDYEVGERHGLERLIIFDERGVLNEYCGEFAGRDRLEARADIVAALDAAGCVEKIEDYTNQIGRCYRCKGVVEPYMSKQWFVKTGIAESVIKKVNAGEVKFYPAQWLNNFNAWMRDLRPWCISRQLWWGHQIPVYYCCACEHEHAAESAPKSCEKCGHTELRQDPDVLDTWFSSGLWAFSTLGHNNADYGRGTLWQDDDLKRFYPNSLLITGFDILFFWVCRMLFQSENELGQVPFKDVYLHALVKDEHGQKMSKSKGNVIDPLDSINTYSADILRFSLALLAVQGRDIRMSEERMILVRNFTNKLYNAANFLLSRGSNFSESCELKTPLGRYMSARFNSLCAEVDAHLESYRFNDAAMALYKFFWDEFCDYGIEFAKADAAAAPELAAVFMRACKLLSPFMPFISEFLYHRLGGTDISTHGSIMVQRLPEPAAPNAETTAVCEQFERIIEALNAIRSVKKSAEITGRDAAAALVSDYRFDEYSLALIAKLAKVAQVQQVAQLPADFAAQVMAQGKAGVQVGEQAIAAMRSKLENREKKLAAEVGKLAAMLGNEGFIARAPAAVVEQNRAAHEAAASELEAVRKELAGLR